MMGVCFLVLFVANNVMGWLGTFYENMSPTSFWLLHAGIGAAGTVLVVVFRRPLNRVLHGPGVKS